MKRILFICFAVVLQSCGYDDFREPGAGGPLPEADMTLEELRRFYDANGNVPFAEDRIVRGTVTASDRSGNFYRSFMIEDATAAVEVKAGLYDLHALFPEGRMVAVKLKGLTCGVHQGMYQIGLKGAASGGYETDYIGHRELLDRHMIRGGTDETFLPQIVSASQLHDGMTGRLVTLYGLTLEGGGETIWGVPAEESWNGRPGEKDIRAWDADGRAVYIYTSGYADFARDTVPAGYVAITGIVMKNGNRFRIKMRSLKDVEIW